MTKLYNNWRTITYLVLLLQNLVVVRPEDGVNDDVTSTSSRDDYLQLAEGGKSLSFKGNLLANLNDWTKRGPKHELNLANGISMVLDKRSTGMDAPEEEKSKTQGIQIMAGIQTPKKPRFLCLHGHASNAEKLKEHFNNWPEYVVNKMDLVFINAPFPILDGFEWFTKFKLKDNMTYIINFDEAMTYIEDCMLELGPFDGVLGFSEGALVTGALPGMQEQGVCLTRVGKIQHVVIISGGKFGDEIFPVPKLAENAYSSPINIPSLHIYGESDVARIYAPGLVKAYVDPLVIHHDGGHEVPKLDEQGLKIMIEFLKKINAII